MGRCSFTSLLLIRNRTSAAVGTAIPNSRLERRIRRISAVIVRGSLLCFGARVTMAFFLADAAGHRRACCRDFDKRQERRQKRYSDDERQQPNSQTNYYSTGCVIRFFSNFILHFGHLPGRLDFTSSCMGQTYWNWVGLLGWAERSFCAVTTGAEYKPSAVKSNAVIRSRPIKRRNFILMPNSALLVCAGSDFYGFKRTLGAGC